jgi:hypothetical protein
VKNVFTYFSRENVTDVLVPHIDFHIDIRMPFVTVLLYLLADPNPPPKIGSELF